RVAGRGAAGRVPGAPLRVVGGTAGFAPRPAPTRAHLADRMREMRASAGEEIVRQGEPGDLFYVIEDGTVEVSVDGQPAHELGRGDAFGEIALLRNVPRTATVTARSDVVLYALDRGTFIPAVTGSGPSLSAAEGVIGMRLGSGRVAAARR